MTNYRLFDSICSLWRVLQHRLADTAEAHPHPPYGHLLPRGEGKDGYATTTGILPIRACHSFGPVWCTEVPCESTATVTGMSCTVNS